MQLVGLVLALALMPLVAEAQPGGSPTGSVSSRSLLGKTPRWWRRSRNGSMSWATARERIWPSSIVLPKDVQNGCPSWSWSSFKLGRMCWLQVSGARWPGRRAADEVRAGD